MSLLICGFRCKAPVEYFGLLLNPQSIGGRSASEILSYSSSEAIAEFSGTKHSHFLTENNVMYK